MKKGLFNKQLDSTALKGAKIVTDFMRCFRDFKEYEEGSFDGHCQHVLAPWVSRSQAWRAFYLAKESGLEPKIIGDKDDYSQEFSINIPVRQWKDKSGFVWVKISRQSTNTFHGKGRKKDYSRERWKLHSSYPISYK